MSYWFDLASGTLILDFLFFFFFIVFKTYKKEGGYWIGGFYGIGTCFFFYISDLLICVKNERQIFL